MVDAGSGTVDITSYRVQGSVGDPQLAEISRATGGKLGASYVDAQFLGPMLQARLGMEDSWRLTADGAVRLKLLEEWERAKRDFDPQRIGPLNVGLPQPILKALYTTDEPVRARLSAAQNGVDGAIVLQPAEARGLFDHAIDPMVDLVRQHLSSVGPGPLPVPCFSSVASLSPATFRPASARRSAARSPRRWSHRSPRSPSCSGR